MLVKLIVICFFYINVNGATFAIKPSAIKLFEDFIKTYNKSYENSNIKRRKFEIFKENLKYIDDLNERHPYATFSITHDADKTLEERRPPPLKINQEQEVIRANTSRIPEYMKRFSSIPKSVDWRDRNAVTPVKVQGKCASCWAFSAVAAIESQYAIKYKKKINLSEQQLVDCVGNNSHGCDGGYPMDAIRYVIQRGGLMLEKDYPYEGHQGKCSESAKKTVTLKGNPYEFQNVSEVFMAHYLAKHGPFAIYLCMHDEINFYKSGIITPLPVGKIRESEDKIDHIVLLAGYGHENGVAFWLIKNSWGTDFGEDGYFRIVRGEEAYGLNEYISIFDM